MPFFRDHLLMLLQILLGNLAMGKLSETIISKTVINHRRPLANVGKPTLRLTARNQRSRMLPNYGCSTNKGRLLKASACEI